MSLATKARVLTSSFGTGLITAISLFFAFALRNHAAPLSTLHMALLISIMVLGLLYSLTVFAMLLALTVYRDSGVSAVLTGEKKRYGKEAESALNKSGCDIAIPPEREGTALASSCSICLEEYQKSHVVF